MPTLKWKTALIKKLNADSILRGKVGNRIYPAYLASLKNPQFPCVNFYSEGGSKRISYSDFATMSIRFWAYSLNNFQEAQDIFDRISVILNNEVVLSNEGNFVFSLMSVPVELHDGELKGVTAAFAVRRMK